MRVEAIPIRDLSPDLVVRWEDILKASPALASPYFRPEFVQLAAGIDWPKR
jgi:hypothetical protein